MISVVHDQPEGSLVQLALCVQRLVWLLGASAGEVGADIHQGRLCPPEISMRGLLVLPGEGSVPSAQHVGPVHVLQQEFERRLQKLLQECALNLRGTAIPLDYGRVVFSYQARALQDLHVSCRIRLIKLAEFSDWHRVRSKYIGE